MAYDILDDEESSWDAIVWTTAKRIRLTLNDIETIEGAITSSLGIIQAAAAQLGGEVARPKAIQEVVNYLNSFKVLLIIDNLETILDPVLVDFLRQLNGRSKVLTTSRVGVGELSYSYPLDKMDLREATRLLRNTARARQVADLATAKAATLEGFCQKMKLNAGFIKWFVTCVQYGKRPDEVLANPKVFLDFCVSYVFEHVSEDAKLVTKAMLAAPGKQSLPLISYLTGLSGDRLEMALLSLQSANILKMSTTFLEEGSETVYELSELPRLYILKNHPPAPAEDAEFKRKKREVVALFDKLQIESGFNKYNPRAIACRNPSDSVSAKLLMEALDLSRRERFEEALEVVKQAAALDPSFHEIYRVEAYVYYWSKNFIAAEEAYETAIAYEPKSPQLRFWYGGFLLRGIHDPKRAREQFDIARQLDGTNLRIPIELARCDLHLGQYEHARQTLEEVLAKEDVPLKERRISYDTYLQVFIRSAQRALAHGDYTGGLRLMREMVESVSERPVEWRDGRILITVAQGVPLINQLVAKCGSEKARLEGVQLVNVIHALPGSTPPSPLEGEAEEAAFASPSPPAAEGPGRLNGKIARLLHERKFGFIRTDTGEEIFFHFSQTSNLNKIYLGADVSFKRGASADGRPVAVSVRGKAYPPRTPIAEGTRFQGTVKKKMATFGFIFCEDGHDYFFHMTNLSPTLPFDELQEGARVAFVAQAAERGTVATEVVLVDD